MTYRYIICGSGLAGSVAARVLAEKGERVLLLEKLDHVGGSVYDCEDQAGVLIHKYGPHIFHTNNKRVYDFLSRFTGWRDYQHRVLARIGDRYLPVPFNITALKMVYGQETADKYLRLLKESFGTDTVSVMSLRSSGIPELRELGNYVYDNIFLYYTVKQWGKSPSEVDPGTTARVPVRLSEDDRYFTDLYQGMPENGYTEVINRLIKHDNITVETSCDALERLKLSDGKIFFDGEETDADIIYTGETDRLFRYRYGALPYRTLDFRFETLEQDSFQPCATVNYTVSEDFTRITEFKKLTGQKINGVTTIMKEYPKEYSASEGEIPYYPVACKESAALYERYLAECAAYPRLHLLGRLAEYRYYNMDAVVARALEMCEDVR